MLFFPKITSRHSVSTNEGRRYTPKTQHMWIMGSSLTLKAATQQVMNDTWERMQHHVCSCKRRIKHCTALHHRMCSKKMHHDNRNRRLLKAIELLALTALAYTSKMGAAGNPTHQNEARFNTDSQMTRINNSCTACTSNRMKDFEGPLGDTN